MFPARSGVLGLIDQRRIIRANHSLTGEPERAGRHGSADQSGGNNGRRRSSIASQGSIESQTLQNSRLIPNDDEVAGAHQPAPAASDAMCVSNALIGLVAAAVQTNQDLEDINFAPKTTTACIARAITALRSFKPTTQLLYKWMRRFEYRTLERADRAAFIELDYLIVVLGEAILALSELGNLLVDIVREAAAAISGIAETVPAYAIAIADASERMLKVDMLMGKLLTILLINDDGEAQRARNIIVFGIAQILQQNTSLADRVRNLEDIFGARALVPPERQAQAINRPPPGYSVPTPRAEVLPDYTASATAGAANADGSVTIQPIGWSIFSGLTLDDLRILSLIPVPLVSGELRYGEMYTFEYSRRVDLQLGNLMEQNTKVKTKRIGEILGMRQDVEADLDSAKSFARRMGMDHGNEPVSGITRRRPRPQPNTIIGPGR